MNAFVLRKVLPHHQTRQEIFNFWRYVKILFLFVLFIGVFLTTSDVFEESTSEEPSVEAQIIGDVRRMETEIAHLFGYAKWPLAPTKVVYSTNCKDVDSYEYHGDILLSCDTPRYRQGKLFEKKNIFGEMESFFGYAEYVDTIAHETAHHFAELFIDPNDRQWKECEPSEYFELSEGFATYVEFEILLRRLKHEKDDQLEQYLAAKMTRYAIQLSMLDKKFNRSVISGIVTDMGFSSESKQYIDSQLARFLQGKPHVLKDEDVVADWFLRGLVRVLALKHGFTKDGFQNGTVKKFFCV